MLRTVLFLLLLLGLLAAAAASARPAHWPFWLGRPERHGSRKLAGDYTHARGSYRYHSRERRGFFGFLHFGSQHPGLARHRPAGHQRQPSHRHPGVY